MTRSDATKTQPLPTNWHWTQDRAPSPAVVRCRYPRTAASVAPTAPMPVIGRAGSKEWARSQAPCFGGGEVR